ncbi:MAG TPA: ThiF family adenylyltransferase [Casimicrobiaceae bacterium]
MGNAEFSYERAFARNIGWLSEAEQQVLRQKRVAIAGLGGVGGIHLLTLARLGIGGFHLADFDRFDLENFNRQTGATMSTVGREKIAVMAELARDVNPLLELAVFPEGVTEQNVTKFLSGVDLYIDGLDFFSVSARELTFRTCAEMRIPAVTVAPLGMGAALLVFLPGRMTFERYFRLAGCSEEEKLRRFLVGLSPALLQRPYLIDPGSVDLRSGRGPSTAMACQICAGIAGTEALKILLGRGRVYAAPWSTHFDAYRQKLVRTWRPGGNRHPLQRFVLAVARRQLERGKAKRASVPAA